MNEQLQLYQYFRYQKNPTNYEIIIFKFESGNSFLYLKWNWKKLLQKIHNNDQIKIK